MSAIDNQYNSAFNANNYLVGSGDELDKDAFLMLMVTQFQYQDPLNPSEDTEFVAQLAEFTALEQMMNLNESMDGLVEASGKELTVGAASFIGLDVSARGYGVSVTNGEASTVFYAHDVDIASGAVNIFDSNNQMVASVPIGATSSGVHEFNWDGVLADGSKAKDGVYTISLSAIDDSGNVVVTDTQVTGTVDGVSTYNGEQFLHLTDGRLVSLAEVREILKPQETTTVEPEEETPAVDPTEGGMAFTVENGAVPALYYTLGEASAATTIKIYDSEKNEIASITGATAAGEHEYNWAGTGTDGDYIVTITAVDANNDAIEVELSDVKSE